MQGSLSEVSPSEGDTSVEVALQDGRSAVLSVPRPSAQARGGFAFGMYKAGSTLLHSALERLCRQADVPVFSIVTEIRRAAGIPIERERLTPEAKAKLEEVFSRRGIVFAGFREFPTFVDLELQGVPTVLLIRDPRDMLTSQYFSLKFSHTTGRGNESVAAARSQLASVEIDEFVLRNSANGLRWFSTYEDGLAGSDLMLRRYEDVIFDKARFFSEVCGHLGVDVDHNRLTKVVEQLDIRPVDENPYRHVRRVTPGDHREKLNRSTIEKLNETFAAVLERHGYE